MDAISRAAARATDAMGLRATVGAATTDGACRDPRVSRRGGGSGRPAVTTISHVREGIQAVTASAVCAIWSCGELKAGLRAARAIGALERAIEDCEPFVQLRFVDHETISSPVIR
jgi:hypothetical protein